MLTQSVAGRVYDYNHCVGTNAQNGRGFSYPVATAVGEGDLVYVLNRSSESVVGVHWSRTGVGVRVSMVNMGNDRDDAEYLGEFSRNGDGDGQLIWPTGMDVDRQRNIYITDEWLDRVSIFDKDGNYLSKWSVAQDGDAVLTAPQVLLWTPKRTCM